MKKGWLGLLLLLGACTITFNQPLIQGDIKGNSLSVDQSIKASSPELSPSPSPTGTPLVPIKGVIVVNYHVTGSNYATAAVQTAYTKYDIESLRFELFSYDGVEHDPLGVTQTTRVDGTLNFTDLEINKNYRIKAFAYKNGEIISKPDSYVDVTLGAASNPILATLNVRLIDVVFNGQATSSVEITPGSYIPIGTESIN